MAEKRLLAGTALTFILFATAVEAAAPTTVILGTPPQPGWSLLSTEQKIILAPLIKEWDDMENIRRKKWLGIAERFPKMSAEEQNRVQQRMREWATLPPDKRAKVRDSYKEFQQLPEEKKLAVKQKWESYYANLPDDEKQRMREGAPPPRPVSAATKETLPSAITTEQAPR